MHAPREQCCSAPQAHSFFKHSHSRREGRAELSQRRLQHYTDGRVQRVAERLVERVLEPPADAAQVSSTPGAGALVHARYAVLAVRACTLSAGRKTPGLASEGGLRVHQVAPRTPAGPAQAKAEPLVGRHEATLLQRAGPCGTCLCRELIEPCRRRPGCLAALHLAREQRRGAAGTAEARQRLDGSAAVAQGAQAGTRSPFANLHVQPAY